MDGARVSTRKFPAYSLRELKAIVADCDFSDDPVKLAEIKAEIASREAGTSVPFVVPQL